MKDLKISKELIKAVLPKETKILSKDFNFTINEDYIEFSDDGEMQFEYCIYKFAFKCKEWLIKNNFSYMVYYDDYFKDYKCTILSIIGCEKRETFIANTEIKSTIKACEWILSEVSK